MIKVGDKIYLRTVDNFQIPVNQEATVIRAGKDGFVVKVEVPVRLPLKYEHYEDELVVWTDGDYDLLENEEVDYKQLYKQQKQRADEAEKRADAAKAKWEKLKQMLSEKELNLKQSRSLNPFCEGELLGTQVSLYLMKILERGEE